MKSFRIVTYNVHKCCGLDRRVRPGRIADVLREVDADIIALQEVLSIEGGLPEENQGRFIADALSCELIQGENRKLKGGAYGNVILSRLPLVHAHNFDLTWRDRERRGCLRADINVGDSSHAAHLLHVFNVHLGTAYIERRFQARKLVSDEILGNKSLGRSRIVLGDFNEWMRGLATRLLSEVLESVDVATHTGSSRTYPGVLPVMHLDHIYFDPLLRLEKFSLHRGRTALIASDHLPMIAEFSLEESAS
ncbi:MAG: endonuclease/exonuclease/phosphatase family protein [Pyrinomonadaceae bacterium]